MSRIRPPARAIHRVSLQFAPAERDLVNTAADRRGDPAASWGRTLAVPSDIGAVDAPTQNLPTPQQEAGRL